MARRSRAQRLVEGLLEPLEAVAAAGLGGVQGDVGFAFQILFFDSIRRRQRDPDTDPDENIVPAELKRLLDGINNA